MYSKVETITPNVAKEYLSKNYKNRNVRQHIVRKYAADMKNGYWQLTPQGISFYENGDLADGQHRLEAVILANCPVDMLVTYDVPKSCTIQDRGSIRSTADVLRMEGLASYAASHASVSLTNFLFRLAGKKDISEGIVKKFICENEKLICESLSLANAKSNGQQLVRNAPSYTAIFCALYCGLNKEDLANFVQVVNTGFYESNQEQAAIVYRNYLIQSYIGNNDSEKRFAFAVATNAVRDFANGIPRQKIYKTNTEPAFWKYVKKNVIDKYLDK